MNQITR